MEYRPTYFIVNILAYLAGTQGLLTLAELIKHRAAVRVVLSDKMDNTEIIELCDLKEVSWSYINQPDNKEYEASLKPSLLISSSFPEKIPRDHYEPLSHGGVNIHASILPKYRGKNSDVWALINDERTLGVTVHRLDDRYDNGQILRIYRFAINDEMVNSEIYAKALSFIPTIINEALNGDLLRSCVEKEGKDIYWRRRTLADSLILWSQPARRIFLFVRALGRDPIYAYTTKDDKKIQIKEARLTTLTADLACGTVVKDHQNIHVVCGDGHLLRLVRFEGADLLNGDRLG